MAVCGHWGAVSRLVLLALVATTGDWPQTAGATGPNWRPREAPMWHCLCLLLPVVTIRAKWQCVATTRGQGCTGALLALVATMGGYPQAAGVGGTQ